MVVLGVHVQSAGKGYKAGFAVLDGDRLQATSSYTAQPGVNEARQLYELVVRAGRLLDEHRPDRLALRMTEGRTGLRTNQVPGLHGEGAVLAAAGERGVEPWWVASGTLRAETDASGPGATARAVEEIVARYEDGLSGEVASAVAVAVLAAAGSGKAG
jgi:hypothetical protein